MPTRRLSRQQKHFQIPTEITLSNDMVNHRTVVEVIASDRPGLLADIGRCFKNLNLNLLSARISTLGEHIEDVFFLVDAENQPLKDTQVVETLQQALNSTISEALER